MTEKAWLVLYVIIGWLYAIALELRCTRWKRKHDEAITAWIIESNNKDKQIYKLQEELENPKTKPVKRCRMIPHKPDCRGYTDVFICTNCQLHIHLGFISKNYGGNYCLECGAEVEDGDTNG